MWTDYVKEWLRVHERTQAWLARKAGLSDSQLNHYFAGRHIAGIKNLSRLEQAMGLAPGTLVGLRYQAPLAAQEVSHGNG